MIIRQSVVKVKCETCPTLSGALNDKSDSEVRAYLERHGWRSANGRDWCQTCSIMGKAKP